MSTKTTFKRIALVAVASLGFGMLSAAPSSAAIVAYTATPGTITPADGSLAVGSPVTLPMLLVNAVDGTSSAATVGTFTATFTQKPINTSLTDASLAANITGQSATYATASGVAGTTIGVTASANTLVATAGSAAAAVTTPSLAGSFVFTPDTPGLYKVAIGFTAGTGTPTATVSSVDAIIFIVGGAALTQSSSGKGSTAGNAVINGSAVAIYHVPGAVAAGAVYNVTSSGVGSIANPRNCDTLDATLEGTDTEVRCDADLNGGTGSTSATINGTNFSDGARFTNTALTVGNVDTSVSSTEASASFTVDAASSVAGVQTITVTSVNQATGVPTVRATVVITWVASTSTNSSAQYSTVYMNAGTTLASSANDDTVAGVNCLRTGVAQCANILVTIKDVNNVALNQASLSATITGPGLLGLAVDGTTPTQAQSGRVVTTTAATPLAANAGVISVWSDGTSGTATITISSGTVVLATKTVIFYGTVATLTATQNLKVARASAAGAELGTSSASATWLTAATTPAVYIVAKDASGSIVPGLTITALSNNSAVIISGAVTQDDATAGDGPGYYNASVTSAPGGTSGASGTVVFRTLLSSGAYISTDAVTFTLGGTVATATLTFDKASYQAGEAMVVTRTAKDSAGNPVYDGVASPLVVFSKAIGGTAPAAGEYRSGVSASSASRPTVFAPSTGGAFEARATFSFAGVSTQVTASATVADDASTAAANAASDAAAEAIDAANAATDAANLAAEAADAATVAAEEARDAADAATAAVEALATEVATLMAALKAQITTLANTVAKIAKKVKA